jgi:glutaredoxin
MKIEIYGAEWCGYCKQAVALCESKSLEYTYVDIDDTAERNKLAERMGTQVRSVPQIYVDDVLVPGGFTGLKQELAKS